MAERKPCGMTNARGFRGTKDQVGKKIRAVREARGLSRAEVGAAYYGAGEDAIRKIEDGTSGSDGYVKLANMAQILKSTPNELLEFGEPDQEAIKGLLEGIAIAFGLPLGRAVALADTVLEVLNSEDIHSAGIPLRESARSVGLYEARQFLRKEQP
jgi:transcriptional regulator with XRE-family HTH domain